MIWTMGGTAGNGAGQTQVQNLVQINLAVNIEVTEKKRMHLKAFDRIELNLPSLARP